MATLDRLAPPAPGLPREGPAWTPRRAIAAAFIAATAIALLQVLQSSSFANTGAKMQKLETERQDLSAQIRQMESEVAALSSLDRVERGARDRLGMVPARRFEFVSVDVESPSGPLLPRPLLSATPEAPPDPGPWWEALLKSLPFH